MEKKKINEEKKVLPCGKFCGWRYVHCYECPAGEYDSDKDMVWCSRNNEWNRRTEGCIASPIS